MSRWISGTTDRALEAAADLILETPPDPPPTPSIGNLCKTVGIGASTFYRLFLNSDEFRRDLAVFSILDYHEPARHAVAVSLETETRATQATTSEAERATLLATLSQTFFQSKVPRRAREADYLPWINHPDIVAALHTIFETVSTNYEEIADSFLEFVGQTTIDSASSEDIMRRLLSVVLAYNLLPTECTWSTAAGDTVSTAVFSHVSLVEALTRPT